MVLPRPTALRGFAPARVLRSTPRTASRNQWQHIARRGYAEGGHDAHGAASSDLPWLIGAVAVTVPSCYFLWPEASHADSHAAHGEEHGEEHAEEHEENEDESKDESEEEAPKEEESKDEEPKEESKDDESKDEEPKEDSKEDDSKSDDDKQPQSRDTPPEGKNQPKSGGDVEGVSFKGPTKAGGDDNKAPDERKVESDSKGGQKKRIDSGVGKNLGEGDLKKDEPATSGSGSDSPGGIDEKQKGLSNTPTRHSTDPGADPEKSSKGEGMAETAKQMGTVDPNRPQK